MASLVGVTTEVTSATGTTRANDLSGLGLQTGDVLIAKVQLRFTAASSATITPPSGEGWTLVTSSRISNSTTHSCAIYWKAWGAGNTDNTTSTFSVTTGGPWNMDIMAWRGLNPVAPFEPIATRVGTATATMTANAARLYYGNRLQLRLWCCSNGRTISSIGGGTTAWNRTDATAGVASACSYTDAVEAGPGATATATQNTTVAVYLSWTLIAVPLVSQANRIVTSTAGQDYNGNGVPIFTRAIGGSVSGLLVSGWVRLPTDWQNLALPWAAGRDNLGVMQVNGTNWFVQCITHNGGGGASTLGSTTNFNANSMLFAGTGNTYVNDYTYANPNVTMSQFLGWCWVAWQVVIGASDVTIRQWFLLPGDTSYNYVQSVITIAAIRTAIGDGAWTPSAITQLNILNCTQGSSYWANHSSDASALYNFHTKELTTLPSDADLDAIRTRTTADTTAYGDWALNRSTTTGATILTDGSGNARSLSQQSGGNAYQAEISPYDLGSGGTTYSADVSESVSESESLGTVRTGTIGAAESVGETEAAAVVATRPIDVNESEASTESNATTATGVIGAAESEASTESIVGTETANASLAESAAEAESATIVATGTVGAAESATESESVAAVPTVTYTASVSESEGVAEQTAGAATFNQGVNETEASAEGVGASRATTATMAESEATADGVGVGAVNAVGATESVASTESASVIASRPVGVSEAEASTESAAASTIATVTAIESEASTEDIWVSKTYTAPVSETVNTAEGITLPANTATPSESVTSSESGAAATVAAVTPGETVGSAEGVGTGTVYTVPLSEAEATADGIAVGNAYAASVAETVASAGATGATEIASAGLGEAEGTVEGVGAGTIATQGLGEAEASGEELTGGRVTSASLNESETSAESTSATSSARAGLDESMGTAEQAAAALRATVAQMEAEGIAESAEAHVVGEGTLYAADVQESVWATERILSQSITASSIVVARPLDPIESIRVVTLDPFETLRAVPIGDVDYMRVRAIAQAS